MLLRRIGLHCLSCCGHAALLRQPSSSAARPAVASGKRGEGSGRASSSMDGGRMVEPSTLKDIMPGQTFSLQERKGKGRAESVREAAATLEREAGVPLKRAL